MPAKSKKQRAFMQVVKAYKDGNIPASKVDDNIKDTAKNISAKDLDDFASTPDSKLSEEEIEEAMSKQARMKLSRLAKKNAKKNAKKRARKMKKKRNTQDLMKSAQRQAKNILVKKMIAKNPNDLTLQDKELLSKKIEKKKGIIKKIAKKLLPKLKTKEAERIKSIRQKQRESLQYLFKNKIPLSENIYRYGSEHFFGTIKYARKLYESNRLKNLSKWDEELLNTDIGKFGIFEGVKVPLDLPLMEAEYQGKDVELNKPKRNNGGGPKFYVYVKDPKTDKVRKISFGASGGGGKLAVKIGDPKARKAFADRHNCEQKKDKMKAGYWSCRLPRYAKSLGLKGGGQWW